MKKYLVVHPKLSVVGENGKCSALQQGAEVPMDSDEANKLVKKGFLRLIVATKPKVTPKAKAKPKAKKKQ
jgi:hypothetical protein